MAFGEMFSELGSYLALDAWTQSMSSSVAGAGKIGYKANVTTFLGGSTYVTAQPSRSGSVVNTGEQTLASQQTIDWSQGELVDDDSPNHFAVDGNGFFLLMDDDKNFYYTRARNFTYQDGVLKTPEGLYVVDKQMLETMTRQLGAGALPSNISNALGVATSVAPNYTGPALSVVDLLNNDSPWVKPDGGTAGGTGMWLPYLASTTQYSGDQLTPASYQSQGISAKTDFWINKGDFKSSVASSLNVTIDNAAFIWVNGHELSQADLTNQAATITASNPWGGYPAASNVTSSFNITPYLHDGANSIQIYGAEWNGGNYLSVNGTVQLNSGTFNITSGSGNNSTWTTKLIGPDLDKDYMIPGAPFLSRPPSHPTSTYEDRMFNNESRDFVLAKVDYKDALKYSKYGNTIFEATPAAGKTALYEQNTGGVGVVRSGKLEAGNVDFDDLSSQMKLAEHMYDGLANVLEARYSNIDTMFQYLLP